MLRSFVKTATLATITTAGLAAAANADMQQYFINGSNPGIIKVASNGQSYTQLQHNGMIQLTAQFHYSTGVSGRIHKWKLTPYVGEGVFQAQGTEAYFQQKSYPQNGRPKEVNEIVVFNIPVTVLNQSLAFSCNAMANQLRQQGYSDQQIFAQDRQIKVATDLDLDIEVTGPGANNPIHEAGGGVDLTVQCSKWNGPAVPLPGQNLAAQLGVIKATMQTKPLAGLNGSCKVETTTAINTTQANANIKYRIHHSTGAMSKVYTTKTAGNKIAVVKHTLDVPNTAGSETGSFQIVGVNPKFSSNVANYAMNCQGTGGFQAQPQAPSATGPSNVAPRPQAPRPTGPSNVAARPQSPSPTGPTNVRPATTKPRPTFTLRSSN